MSYTELLQTLHITNPPASWQRNYELAANTLDQWMLPTQEELVRHDKIYRFPDQQLEQMVACSSWIQSHPELKVLWHLWYTVLFTTNDCAVEHYSEWPVPEAVEALYPGVFRSLVIIAHTDRLAATLSSKQLPPTYFSAALSTFLECTRDQYDSCGYYGLSNEKMWWLQPYMLGHLYRLGRLQYEIASYPEGTRIYRHSEGQDCVLYYSKGTFDADSWVTAVGDFQPRLTEEESCIRGYGFDAEGRLSPKEICLDRSQWQLAVQAGDDVLSVHIPKDGKLSMAAVLESFEEARIFFRKHFPELNLKAFILHTWLLDTQLENLLPPNSNIRDFQKLFTIMLKEENDSCLFDFIFHTKRCPLEQLVPRNDFQSRILKFVQHGGHLRSGFGYILMV
jgi:hypothetical protein